MSDYFIRKLLSESEIDLVKQLIESANKNNSWQDGLSSGGGKKSIKNNFELSDFDILNRINSIVMERLDVDVDFLNMTVADTSFLNIVSKTGPGGYYHPHTDLHFNGDYSTTVFLNSPKEYEGGELCLYLNNEEKKIKLDAGWAVTYKTGTLHRVNRVISGCRYVSVLWTRSKIKDDFIRNVCSELNKILKLIEETQPNSLHIINFEGVLKDPQFLTKNLLNEIIRKYN